MKAKQIAQFREYERIIGVFDSHLAVWKEVPEMSKSFDRFVRNFKKISDLKADLEISLEPVLDQYRQHRESLLQLLSSTLGVARLYAGDAREKKLKKALEKAPEDLNKLSDKGILKLAWAIGRSCVRGPVVNSEESGKEDHTHVPDPADYGIRPEICTGILNAADDFHKSAEDLGHRSMARENTTQAITKLMRKNNRLLTERLERFMQLVEHEHPDFYAGYQSARERSVEEIHSTGGHIVHGPLDGDVA